MEISKLGRHRLADDDGPCLPQLADGSSIRIRATVGEHWRATFGRIVRGIENILDADWNPVQRADALAICLKPVERARLLECMFGIEMGESLDIAFGGRDLLKTGTRIFFSRHRAARDVGCGLRRCEFDPAGVIQIGVSYEKARACYHPRRA